MALETLYVIAPDFVTPNLTKYAGDPEPIVRQTALSIMRHHQDPMINQQAAEMLQDWAGSIENRDRIVAAGVIGHTAVAEDTALLLNLLSDTDLGVRQSALRAAAEARFPEAWPIVISTLACEETKT